MRIVAVSEARREVRIGEELFTVYRTDDDPPIPLCYPLLGPKGRAMSRQYPFAEVKGEPRDHPHQRSFWFAHGDVNGVDFWAVKPGGPSIRHELFVPVAGAAGHDTLRALASWLDAEGRLVCRDDRSLRFFCDDADTLRGIDHAITLHALATELRFGDTKEGLLGFRMVPSLALTGEGAKGRVIDSEGREGAAVWGKRARWIAYDGPIDGARVGVVMMDHPSNLRHPTWWHARDYGLAAANPFGQHDFEGVPGKPGEYVLQAQGALTLRHRIVFFEGPADAKRIETWFDEFARAPSPATPSATSPATPSATKTETTTKEQETKR